MPVADLTQIELEEIVVADLVRWTGWDLEIILNRGYFAMHWLWGPQVSKGGLQSAKSSFTCAQ